MNYANNLFENSEEFKNLGTMHHNNRMIDYYPVDEPVGGVRSGAGRIEMSDGQSSRKVRTHSTAANMYQDQGKMLDRSSEKRSGKKVGNDIN